MMGGVMDSQKNASGAIYSPPSLPFASFPAAASVPGQYRIASDLNNASLRSDGTYWSPANGHAVIASGNNANLTVQSLTETLITSVPFPANFVRPGSRIITWQRFRTPSVGGASRVCYIRAGAVGVGLAGGILNGYSVSPSGASVDSELVNTTIAVSSNGQTLNSVGGSIGRYLGFTTGNYSGSVNFTNPWEIGFTGQSCAETAQTSVTAIWSAGVATFTKTAHGYAIGDKIVNTTFDRAGYNGTLIVTGAAANTWTAAIAADPGGAGSGGTTTRTSNVTLVDYYVEWIQ